MKKVLLLSVLMALTTLFVNADPAKKVTLTYKSGKLLIIADHPVKDVNSHYIDLITITIDGKDVKEIKLTKQSSNLAETLEVDLPGIKPGSTIQVKTRCNQFGNKSAKLKV